MMDSLQQLCLSSADRLASELSATGQLKRAGKIRALLATDHPVPRQLEALRSLLVSPGARELLPRSQNQQLLALVSLLDRAIGKPSAHQSGNVLFLILIAVALFAALGYAVTQSSSGGGDAKSEMNETDLGQIEQYASSLQAGVSRLMMVNGCTDQQLSAEYPSSASDYRNFYAPSSKACHLFDKAGAGIAWQRPPLSSRNLGASEYAIIAAVGVLGLGLDTCERVELMLSTLVSKELCIAVNEKNGTTNPSGSPPVAAALYWNFPASWEALGFWSRIANEPSVYKCGDHIGHGGTGLELRGKAEGCFYSNADKRYYYYNVLLPR